MAGICLLAICPFFIWGSPSGHDFEFHMYSWMEVLGQWKHGIIYPRWAGLAHWGYGEARFLFYPPASWTLGALLGAILPWRMVPGAYCWIALTLAAGTMYKLSREWLPQPDALFAALLFALNPYHLVIIYWRSAFAELLAAAILPLVLFCLLRLREPGVRPTLCLGAALAVAWLTNAPVAIMIHYSTVGLAILLAIQEALKKSSHRFRVWSWNLFRLPVCTALAILLGAGLASFYLLPAVYEQHWVTINQVLSPGVRPLDNFLFTKIADADHNRFNFLISLVALVEITVLCFAMCFARIRGEQHYKVTVLGSSTRAGDARGYSARERWMQLSVWGATSAVFTVSVSNQLWQHLPRFRFIQLPFRWLLCLNAALVLLLTMATRRWGSRLLVFTVLLATLLFAGHRVQPPWWDQAADIREMSDAMADGTGYEGVDEYVPAGADPYAVKKELPAVSDNAGAPIHSVILTWNATEKHFKVRLGAPLNLIVRVFHFPAWEATVNGKPLGTGQTKNTGLLVIPAPSGESDIDIRFRETGDRILGAVLSLLSIATFLVSWKIVGLSRAGYSAVEQRKFESPAA